MQSPALDHEYYIGYRIPVTGGDVTIDSVRLAHSPEGVTASFVAASGPCAIGTSSTIFEGCDPTEAHGAVVANGTEGVIIGGYTLDHDGTYDLGPVVVSYRSGLHVRTVTIDPAGCLTTEVNSLGCTETFGPPGWPHHEDDEAAAGIRPVGAGTADFGLGLPLRPCVSAGGVDAARREVDVG